jgi:monofunctional chorismate mutase
MEINEIRETINQIDSQMAELFVKRMEAVSKVAEFKSERGLAIEDTDRERSLIERNSALIENDELRPLYIDFLRSTMDISKSWQSRLMNGLRVACAGEKESSGHLAAKKVFPDADTVRFKSCQEAYQAVADGECDVAVLPLENSYSGEVGKVYDLIFSGELFVNAVHAFGTGNSTTRYAVLSRAENKHTEGADNEAFLIMFTVRDEIGGLAKAINIISANDFNMRVMRSRPMKDLQWHYYFYAELVGDCSDESAARIQRLLSTACPVVKIKGRFRENGNEPAGGMGI